MNQFNMLPICYILIYNNQFIFSSLFLSFYIVLVFFEGEGHILHRKGKIGEQLTQQTMFSTIPIKIPIRFAMN